MSDTVLALIITGMVLLMLAAWVPLLHAAERMMRRNSRQTARETLDAPKKDKSYAEARETA